MIKRFFPFSGNLNHKLTILNTRDVHEETQTNFEFPTYFKGFEYTQGFSDFAAKHETNCKDWLEYRIDHQYSRYETCCLPISSNFVLLLSLVAKYDKMYNSC